MSVIFIAYILGLSLSCFFLPKFNIRFPRIYTDNTACLACTYSLFAFFEPFLTICSFFHMYPLQCLNTHTNRFVYRQIYSYQIRCIHQ